MAIIKIDNKEYDSTTLSEDARQQLKMLQFVEAELVRLQAQSAVLQTARIGYASSLKQALSAPVTPFGGDTLKLG